MKDEIKEALEKATPDWYYNGNEIVSRKSPRCGIGGFLTDEDNVLAANAPEWLRWQNERIEKLEKEVEHISKYGLILESMLLAASGPSAIEIARNNLGKEE